MVFIQIDHICIPCIKKDSIYVHISFIKMVCDHIFSRYCTYLENNGWLLIENQRNVYSFRSSFIDDHYWDIYKIADMLDIKMEVHIYDGWINPLLFDIHRMHIMLQFLMTRDENKYLWILFGKKCKRHYISRKKELFYDIHMELIYKPLIGYRYFELVDSFYSYVF